MNPPTHTTKLNRKRIRHSHHQHRTRQMRMGLLTPSPNHEGNRSMPHFDMRDLFAEVVARCYTKIKARIIVFPLAGKIREDIGDFAFFGVIDICNQLRQKDPNLFVHTTPKAIAENIKEEFEKQNFDMIRTLSLHDAGILTFRLEGRWIAQRINKMLKDGINTWAPTIFDAGRRGRVVFVFPSYTGTDIVRAIYIKETLANLYLYSGVDVGSGFCDDAALGKVHTHFTRREREIVSVSHQTRVSTKLVSQGSVYTDLGTLWNGARTQAADVIVYMTPHQLRGYIEQCHTAAANEGWLQDVALVSYCGFREFSDDEEGKLSDLWAILESSPWNLQIGAAAAAAGYSRREFFECAFKFTCLKRHRLANFRFELQDIFGEETFMSLLRIQALARSLATPSLQSDLNLNVLVGMERELGLHFVEFTRVIYRVCDALVPHVLCKYLCNLSMLFERCYKEVWSVSFSENMLGLCKATRVVMKKCFQLLGIAPSSHQWTREFESLVRFPTVPSSKYDRNEHPNSRLEIFSLNVSVSHSQFDDGSITGRVTFVDKCRLADGKGWVRLDKNDNCHVSVFDREWFNDFPIQNGSFIPLGDMSCVRSVPISSSIEFDLLIKATSENKDQTYLIYNGIVGADLTKFWKDGELKTKRGSIEVSGDDGRVQLNFVAIKEAVDTTMQLLFSSYKNVRLSGTIEACYGKDILEDSGLLGEYTAHIFRADPSEQIPCGGPILLPLYKSALAVPAASECLRMRADLVDLETKTCIVNEEVELSKSESVDGVSTWKPSCSAGFLLELRVNWVP